MNIWGVFFLKENSLITLFLLPFWSNLHCLFFNSKFQYLYQSCFFSYKSSCLIKILFNIFNRNRQKLLNIAKTTKTFLNVITLSKIQFDLFLCEILYEKVISRHFEQIYGKSYSESLYAGTGKQRNRWKNINSKITNATLTFPLWIGGKFWISIHEPIIETRNETKCKSLFH